MTTVQFKKTSGSGAESYSAVRVHISYVEDGKTHTAIDGTRTKIVRDTWKKWSIAFSILSESQMDYLEELKIEEAPQAIISSTTYDVTIESLSAKPKGGSIVVLNRDAEV